MRLVTSVPRNLRSIVHILPPARLLIWLHERNAIKTAYTVLPEDEHLILETCKRKYNRIETLM